MSNEKLYEARNGGKEVLSFNLSTDPRDFYYEEERGELYVVSGRATIAKNYLYKISLLDKGRCTRIPVKLGRGIVVHRERAYVLDYWANEILVIGNEDLDVITRVRIRHNPMFIEINPDKGELYVLTRRGHLYVFDLYSMIIIREIEQHFSKSGGMILNKNTGILYLTHKGQVLQAVDVQNHEIIKSVKGEGAGSTGINLDNKRAQVIINYFMERYIDIYDQESLEFIKRLRFKTGFKRVLFDERRGLLYMADYFNGNLYVVDMTTGHERKQIFLCKKIRSMKMSEDRNTLIVGSACGIIGVSLDALD